MPTRHKSKRSTFWPTSEVLGRVTDFLVQFRTPADIQIFPANSVDRPFDRFEFLRDYGALPFNLSIEIFMPCVKILSAFDMRNRRSRMVGKAALHAH